MSFEEAVEGVIPSALAAVVEVGAIGAFLWMGIGGMFGFAFIDLLVEGVDGGFCSSRNVRCASEWVSMTA